jgi:hypothetical protein
MHISLKNVGSSELLCVHGFLPELISQLYNFDKSASPNEGGSSSASYGASRSNNNNSNSNSSSGDSTFQAAVESTTAGTGSRASAPPRSRPLRRFRQLDNDDV